MSDTPSTLPPAAQDRGQLKSQLDALAHGGARCLRQWNFRSALRDAFSRAPRWLFAGPLAVVIVQSALAMAGRSSAFSGLLVMALAAVVGSALYVCGAVAWSWLRFHPRRDVALALHDRHLETKDRLVTADEFLRSSDIDKETIESGFMRAAVADARESAQRALASPLPALPVDAWRVQPSSWWGALAAVAVILLGWLALDGLLPAANPTGRPVSVVAEASPAGKQPAELRPMNRKTPRPPTAMPEAPSAADSSKNAVKPQRRLAKKDQNMDGEPGSGGGSQASTSNVSNQSAGMAPSQRTTPKEKTEAKREEPQDEKEEAPGKKKQKRRQDKGQLAMQTNSGQGKASNSSSLMNQFESPEEADKSGIPLKGDVEDEESEDEDEQEKSNSASKPTGNQKDPPVDRNLSTRPPGEGDQPQNGRGGPGAIKKTRGVPSMILGIPIADRVPGTPSPGRSKVSQEFSRPKEETHPDTDALAQNTRTGVVGHIEQPDLLPWRRELIENYFISIRQVTDPGVPAPADK